MSHDSSLKAEDKSFLFYVKKRRLLAGARRSASLHTDSHYIPSKREFHSFPTATAEQRSFKDMSNKFILQKKVKNNDNAAVILLLSVHLSVVSSEKISLVHSRVFRLQPWHQCRNLDPVGPACPGTLSLLGPRGQSVLPYVIPFVGFSCKFGCVSCSSCNATGSTGCSKELDTQDTWRHATQRESARFDGDIKVSQDLMTQTLTFLSTFHSRPLKLTVKTAAKAPTNRPANTSLQ